MRTRARFLQTSSTEPASQAREDGYAAGPLSEIEAAQKPESAARSFTVSPGRRAQAKGSGRGSGRLVLSLPLTERTFPRTPTNLRQREGWGTVLFSVIANGLGSSGNEDERPPHLAERVMHHHVAPFTRLAVLVRQLAEFAEVLLGIEPDAGIDDRPADVVVGAPMHVSSDAALRRPPPGNALVIGTDR